MKKEERRKKKEEEEEEKEEVKEEEEGKNALAVVTRPCSATKPWAKKGAGISRMDEED